MSESTWNGNLGDLAGADAKCLTELTTNTGWKGYAEANSRGILTSGHVHAFLCDGARYPGTCDLPQAYTTFYFADANDSTHGGNRFSTDGNQRGPYDVADWNGASYFGANYTYWTDISYDGQAGVYGLQPDGVSDAVWDNNAASSSNSVTAGTLGCGADDSWDDATSAKSGQIGFSASGGKGLGAADDSAEGVSRWIAWSVPATTPNTLSASSIRESVSGRFS